MKRHHLLTLFMLLAALLLPAARAAAAPARDSAAPNDTTQGRLRVNQCVDGASRVDLYVNGQVAMNGGVAQTNVGLETTGYLYLPPGKYTLGLVPSGQGLDHPFLGPLDVQVAAGHRYTVVALGQKEDATHQALVIDETAAYQAVGAASPDSQHLGHITVNNIHGAPGIHFSLASVPEEHSAAYGDFEAAQWPAFAQSLDIVTNNSPSEVIGHADGPIFNPPGSDNMDCVFGTYPGTNDSRTTTTTSSLDPTAFLQRFNDLGTGTQGQTPTFHTFLALLEKTGLAQMPDTGGPYLLFAPSDEAFAALPSDQLARLQTDPRALADLVRAQVVPGYYPPGTLGKGGTAGGFDRTVTNLLGTPLVLTGHDQLIINGETVGGGGDYAMVANGTRLFWTGKLILPAAQPANPVPGMPTTGARSDPANLLALLGAALALLLAGGLLRRGAMRH